MKAALKLPALAALAAFTAIPAHASLIAEESFDYPVSSNLTGLNGGNGWSSAWAVNGTNTIAATSSGDVSLWFGQSPLNINDGSGHVAAVAARAAERDFSPAIPLGTETLYFTALVRVESGNTTADFRAEFYDGPGATGNMRANVGISDGSLYLDADTPGYLPAGNTSLASQVANATTYLLAMKRTGSGISASLIAGNGDPGTLASEPTSWQITQAGVSGVSLKSMAFFINGAAGAAVRMDQMRIATDWNSAVGIAAPPASPIDFMSLFADNMVIQRDKPVKIWGTCPGIETGALISVTFGSETTTTTAADGRWSVEFPARSANAAGQRISVSSGTHAKSIAGVLIGDVWLCSGQSNMKRTVSEFPTAIQNDYAAIANNGNIRVFNVPQKNASTPQAEFFDSGTVYWSTPSATEVLKYSAYGYAFAYRLQNEINVPVGIINSSYGGTLIQHWLTPAALAAAGTSYGQNMFNIMIHPLIGIHIKGILWYQGESNVPNTADYNAMFREYLNLYRNEFNDADLPVITTQLPKYQWVDAKYQSWPQFRLLQWQIAQTYPNVHVVCGIDLGDPSTDIHPYDKLPFGTRAAELALNKVYGKSTPGESPYPTRYSVSGDAVTITFGNAESGLLSSNGPIGELYLVAADGTKALASATINGNQIQASAAGISSPSGVEYAIAPAPSVNFHAANGLPVAPFASNDYSKWSAEYKLAGAQGGQDGDFDADGLDNFMEYALGGNPNIGDALERRPSIQYVEEQSARAIHFTHTERTDDLALRYTVEVSSTLLPGSWTDTQAVEISRSAAAGYLDTVTSRIDFTGTEKFIRLKVKRQ